MVEWDEYKDGGWRSSFDYAADEEDDRPRFLIVIPPNTQVAAEYQHGGDDYYWEARDSCGTDDGYAATLEAAQAAAEADARARGWLDEAADHVPVP